VWVLGDRGNDGFLQLLWNSACDERLVEELSNWGSKGWGTKAQKPSWQPIEAYSSRTEMIQNVENLHLINAVVLGAAGELELRRLV
jgi:hypothetical protein